jgi:Neurotransmitter-gated ion-channel ligand binding domain
MASRTRRLLTARVIACAVLMLLGLVLPRVMDAAAAPVFVERDIETSTVPPPPAAGGQILIRAGIYVLNLVALDEVSQTFTFTGYLTETWKDPRLAFTPGQGEDATARRYYRKTDIWFPMLQFDNSDAPRVLSAYLMKAYPDGTVVYTEKFATRVSTIMHLRAFPFDSQELELVVRPFTGQENRIVLRVDPQTTGISQAPYTPLPLWHTGPVTSGTVTGANAPNYAVHTRLMFDIHVTRNSEYYIFRIFLPLTLMVAVSWGVLWIPPSDLNSQLLISVTTLLTLVAFSVALSNVLPPVPYLMFHDIFFLDAFFFIMLSIGESLFIHAIFHSAGHEAALRARRTTRVLMPILFVLTIPLLSVMFLR